MDWHSSLLKAFRCFNQVGFNTSVNSHPELSSLFHFPDIILVSSLHKRGVVFSKTLQIVFFFCSIGFSESAVIGCVCIGACLEGWAHQKSARKQRTIATILWLTSGVEKARLSRLPVCVFASPVNMNFTVYCRCLSQRNAPPSPFNIMTLSSLIAFWEAHVVLTLASWLHFPWCIMMVLSFCLSSLGRQFASEQQL